VAGILVAQHLKTTDLTPWKLIVLLTILVSCPRNKLGTHLR